MPAPSKLAIATSSVQRLVKEEASYHKELDQQQAHIAKLEAAASAGPSDEDAEYALKQEKTAVEETKAVFPSLHKRIADAVEKLEDQLQLARETGAPEEEITNAVAALELAQTVLKN